MRNGKIENTQDNTSSPLTIEPEIIQGFYDNLSEFFEISPVDKAVRFLNEVFCYLAYYEYDEEKETESPESNILVKNVKTPRVKTIEDYKRMLRDREKSLERASDFYWKSTRIIELIVDLNEFLVALTAVRMSSEATKSLLEIGLGVHSPKPAES